MSRWVLVTDELFCPRYVFKHSSGLWMALRPHAEVDRLWGHREGSKEETYMSRRYTKDEKVLVHTTRLLDKQQYRAICNLPKEGFNKNDIVKLLYVDMYPALCFISKTEGLNVCIKLATFLDCFDMVDNKTPTTPPVVSGNALRDKIFAEIFGS